MSKHVLIIILTLSLITMPGCGGVKEDNQASQDAPGEDNQTSQDAPDTPDTPDDDNLIFQDLTDYNVDEVIKFLSFEDNEKISVSVEEAEGFVEITTNIPGNDISHDQVWKTQYSWIYITPWLQNTLASAESEIERELILMFGSMRGLFASKTVTDDNKNVTKQRYNKHWAVEYPVNGDYLILVTAETRGGESYQEILHVRIKNSRELKYVTPTVDKLESNYLRDIATITGTIDQPVFDKSDISRDLFESDEEYKKYMDSLEEIPEDYPEFKVVIYLEGLDMLKDTGYESWEEIFQADHGSHHPEKYLVPMYWASIKGFQVGEGDGYATNWTANIDEYAKKMHLTRESGEYRLKISIYDFRGYELGSVSMKIDL